MCSWLTSPLDHLDVANIRWLEDRKMKIYKGVKGNIITVFVEKYPEKKTYFKLSNEMMKFAFSEPGPLEGTKSCNKVILRMTSMDFQCPTQDKPTSVDMALTVRQDCRVAVIGANGATKPTAIKVLVSEPLPISSSIWKAAGLRLAYVAQHAFHHIEKHMPETPTQYIMWRFAGSNDKELLIISAFSPDRVLGWNSISCSPTGLITCTMTRSFPSPSNFGSFAGHGC